MAQDKEVFNSNLEEVMDLIEAPKGFKPASQERLDALYVL